MVKPNELLALKNYEDLIQNLKVWVFRNLPWKNWEFVLVNNEFCKLFGYSLKEFENLNISASDLYVNSKERICYSKELIWKWEIKEYEVQLRKKDGSTFWAATHARSVLDHNGKILYFEWILEDITNRKKAEENLRESFESLKKIDKLKDTFISEASHELRTPLTVMKGYVSLLLDETLYKLIPWQKKILDKIYKNINQLLSLINNILDFKKLELNKFEKVYEEIPLPEYLKELNEGFEIAYKGKNIKLILENKENINCVLYSDSWLLRRIFDNLLSNAFKFTEDNWIIKVWLENCSKDWFIKFYVKDNWIGIPKNKRNKIFENFSQIENRFQREFRGTGLGLAIVKRIIEELGGKIWLESELNKWTNFYFILPLRNE